MIKLDKGNDIEKSEEDDGEEEISEDDIPSIIDIETYDRFKNDNNKDKEKEEEEITIDQICKQFRDNGGCPYYNKDQNYLLIQDEINSKYLDIEELKILAKEVKFCPLYYMRNYAQFSEIIFMSYNYIFNDIFRGIMKIGPLLNDSILVVDEAHNILNLCEDSKTKSIDYKNIIDEIKRLNDEKNTNNKEKKEDKNKKENMKNKEKKEHKNKKENINYKEKKEYEIKIEEYRGNILEYLEILQKGMFRFYEEKKKHLSKIKPYCMIDKKDLLSIFNIEIYDIILCVINKYLELISKEHKADKKLEKIRSFIWLLNHIKICLVYL